MSCENPLKSLEGIYRTYLRGHETVKEQKPVKATSEQLLTKADVMGGR